MLLATSAAYAQPGCRSRVLPEPPAAAWGVPTTLLGAQIVYAEPPLPGELWGHIVYPLNYTFPTGATNVGLMYFTAEVPTWYGDTVNSWFPTTDGKPFYDPNKVYVWSPAGPVEWLDKGITFEGYHILDDELGPKGTENTWAFRATQHFGQAASAPMSIVMQPHESWTVGVTNIRYKVPIMTMVQLHLRECFPLGSLPNDKVPGGGR